MDIKATLDRNTMMEIMSRITLVAQGKNLKILDNVLLTFKDGNFMEARGTDIEVDLKMATSNVTAEGEGRVLVPAKDLYDMTRVMSPGEMTFVTDGTTLLITQGKTKFKMACADPETYPEAMDITPNVIMCIKDKGFMRLLSKVEYARGNNESQYAYLGVCLKPKGSILEAAATNGGRMAIYSVEMQDRVESSGQIVIPGTTVEKLPRLIGDEEGVVISSDGQRVSFAASGVLVVSRLINAAFPDYAQIIPVPTEETYTVNREDAIRAMKKAQIVASRTGIVNIAFDGKVFNLMVEGVTDRIDDVLEVTTAKTEPWALNFGVQQLLNALIAMEGKEVKMQFPVAGTGGVMSMTEGEHINLIMPMKI
jgi:DNA polymerase-3 subunit beta